MAKRKKSHKKLIFFVVTLLLVAAILVGLYVYFFVYKGYDWNEFWANLFHTEQGENPGESDPENPPDTPDIPDTPSSGEIQTGELSIHFMELGNKYAGDSTLIKIGDTEVLIDAGSRQSSAETLVPYIQQYCTDGILEYVIATHADQDHIAAFVGTKTAPGIFDSFEVQTVIDFPKTNKDTVILNSYYEKRDAEIAAGATHYTALQCYNQTDGASRSITLAENVTMNILYNYYYENHSSDENNYSVCMLLTQGEYNYLFTGDLEEKGEEYLVQYNTLPKCKLFKGGHHGSKTSSTEALLSVIQPEVVCVCCCAGAPEYTKDPDNVFPTQDFVTRVGRYTDQIYVTTLATEIDLANKKWEYTSMNGNIVVTSNGVNFAVNCSNNNVLLKDTEWFKANRVWVE